MMKRISAIIFGALLVTSSLFFVTAYAIDNNCTTSIIHIIQLSPSLQCVEKRLDALENASTTDSTTASNLGASSSLSEEIFAQEVGNDLQFKRLLEGANISLSSNATHVTVTNSAPYSRIFQDVFETDQVSTKTNIGTTYVDVYTIAFSIEDMAVIDCGNATQFRIRFLWDYVGTGNQQTRWVDVGNNANVLWESGTFTADQDSGSSGTQPIPSWCTGLVTIEQQGKSTVASDDPVPQGYIIWFR